MKKTFFDKKKNIYNRKHLWSDRLVLVHFIESHKLSTCYHIFYKNGVAQIENANKIEI